MADAMITHRSNQRGGAARNSNKQVQQKPIGYWIMLIVSSLWFGSSSHIIASNEYLFLTGL